MLHRRLVRLREVLQEPGMDRAGARHWIASEVAALDWALRLLLGDQDKPLGELIFLDRHRNGNSTLDAPLDQG